MSLRTGSARRRLAGAAVALLALFPAGLKAAEPVEIRASVGLPSNHPVVTDGWRMFQEAVADRNADLHFRLFVNGAVIGAERPLKGLSQGEADMGFIAPIDYPEAFPYTTALGATAMGSPDGLAAAAALTELTLLHCQPCRNEFAEKNLIFLGTYSAAPYLLIAKAPMTDARSLSGRRIWTPGSLWDRWTRELGAYPMPESRESAQAFDKGGADVVIDVAMTLRVPPFSEKAQAVMLLPLGGYRGASPFTVNRDFWGTLSPAQRAALLSAAPAGLVAATLTYNRQSKESLDMAQEQGIALVQPDAGMKQAAESLTREGAAVAAGLAETPPGPAGIGPLRERYRELYGKYRTLFAPIADGRQAVAILQREVFDKANPTADIAENAPADPAPAGEKAK